MLRIAVCDAVPTGMEQLSGYLSTWSRERSVATQLMKFQSGEEILFEMELSGDFAVIFTGVELSGMNGIETALRVRKQNRLTSIVFVVEKTRYLKDMLQIYPAQFVLGQITRRKIFETMDRFLEERRYFHEDFPFRFNHHSYMIDLQEVLYFVSEGRVVRIFLETGKRYQMYERLDEVEKRLEHSRNPFIRIHQSYLVNGRHIEWYHSRKVMLRSQDELPVSRKRRGEIVKWYCEGVVLGQKMP